MTWKRAIKKPVEILYREVIGEYEIIHTREGKLKAVKGRDYVIRGVEGEEYPITKTIFDKTYKVVMNTAGLVICYKQDCNGRGVCPHAEPHLLKPECSTPIDLDCPGCKELAGSEPKHAEKKEKGRGKK